MIYLDTSVVLAHLLAEDRRPPAGLWEETLVSSRFLEYEVWNRVHALGLARTHRAAVEAVLARLAFLELTRPALARAVEPFPGQVRTLDALHLASIECLRAMGQAVRLASYDRRLSAAAKALKVPLVSL